MKVKDVHDHAFEASKDVLEDLNLSGPGMADANNELEFFPMKMLEDFPNLKYFLLQLTSLKDDTFSHHFDQLHLPSLEHLSISGGELTHIPKFPRLPKLTELRFCYHPIASITNEAFSDLESLEWLDLSGNGKNQTLTHLDSNSLLLSSKQFQKLDLGYFNSLVSFSPNFISIPNPNVSIDFVRDNLERVEEDVFRSILETMLPGNGTVRKATFQKLISN